MRFDALKYTKYTKSTKFQIKNCLWGHWKHCTEKKVSIKDFFSKCYQIRRKLRIWSHVLKKSLIENFIFCAVKSKSLKERGEGGSQKKRQKMSFCEWRAFWMTPMKKHVWCWKLTMRILKACVRYFWSNFYFSPNDSPPKTVKNVLYFI